MATAIHFDLTITVTCKQKDIPAPDLLNTWIHPGWSCIWSSCQIQSTACEEGNTSVFHVVGVMSPLPSSSLMHGSNVKPQELKQIEAFDLLKIHFFTKLPQKIERRYTCSAPLSGIIKRMREKNTDGLRLEAWSRADAKCEQLDRGLEDVCIEIMKPKVWIHQSINEKVNLKAVKPLRRAHCRRVKYIGNWIATQLKDMYPDLKTGFINIRVPGPDWELLYPDTQRMFSLGECNLPPSLALYVVCNALRMHSLTPDTFMRMATTPADARQVELLLNVTRDVLAPWTMCRVEGRYYPDTCLGKDCDDQPFVMVDIPGENVTPKEDCEGKAQVVLHFVQLLLSMYRDAVHNNSEGLLAHWRQYPVDSPTNCLRFPGGMADPAFQALLQACFCIGRHFEEGRLEVHMAVGDVYFREDEPEGHAYCVLKYNDARRRIFRGVILEATAWDATRNAAEETVKLPPHAVAAARNLTTALKRALSDDLYSAGQNCLPGDTKQPKHIYVRSDYTDEHRAQTYSETFTCDGCLLFTSKPGVGSERPKYGVNVEAFSTQLPLITEDTTDAPTQPFRISVRSFITALRDGQHGWPRAEGAEEVLDEYDKYRREIDGYKQTYRPPPLQEAEIMRRMRAWQPLGADDVIAEQRNDPLTQKHSMAFCWTASAPMPKHLQDAVSAAVATGILTESACMHSRVFSFHTPTREPKSAVRF